MPISLIPPPLPASPCVRSPSDRRAMGWMSSVTQRPISIPSDRRAMGWVLMSIGLWLIFYFVAQFDPSVPTDSSGSDLPDRIVNTHRLAIQHQGFLGGLACWLSGLLCFLIPAERPHNVP